MLDGIVTVSVTGEPMYNSTNGIFSAVILSTTGHICQLGGRDGRDDEACF